MKEKRLKGCFLPQNTEHRGKNYVLSLLHYEWMFPHGNTQLLCKKMVNRNRPSHLRNFTFQTKLPHNSCRVSLQNTPVLCNITQLHTSGISITASVQVLYTQPTYIQYFVLLPSMMYAPISFHIMNILSPSCNNKNSHF